MEALASLQGQLAMLRLEKRYLEQKDGPVPSRLKSYHELRIAARRDPIAAYNLGNFMSESAEMEPNRRKRRKLALRLFEAAAVMGMERLKNASETSAKAPKKERDLRDIISRALTNIGSEVSNAGYPERAVEHFRRSITLFHDNSNTHVCLGNMGVFHNEETGIDPLDGIASWENAAKIGDYCHESDFGCPCRSNAINIARQVESDYGKDEARNWIAVRYAIGTNRKSAKDFAHVAAGASDIARLTGRAWHPDAIKVANIVGDLLKTHISLPLEMKVTLAACLIGSLARLDTPHQTGDPAILDRAIDAALSVEPLRPFLGDHEWQDIGPPKTLYLTENDTVVTIMDIVTEVVLALHRGVRDLRSANAVLGAMFHLDRNFRHGITSMVRDMVLSSRVPYFYLPGMVIGSPARQ
jgi:hypothetical protein